jgi:hypothetical protein
LVILQRAAHDPGHAVLHANEKYAVLEEEPAVLHENERAVFPDHIVEQLAVGVGLNLGLQLLVCEGLDLPVPGGGHLAGCSLDRLRQLVARTDHLAVRVEPRDIGQRFHRGVILGVERLEVRIANFLHRAGLLLGLARRRRFGWRGICRRARWRRRAGVGGTLAAEADTRRQ